MWAAHSLWLLTMDWQCRCQEELRVSTVKESLSDISILCSIKPSKGKQLLRGHTNCLSDLRATETNSEGTTAAFLFLLKAEFWTGRNDKRNNDVQAIIIKLPRGKQPLSPQLKWLEEIIFKLLHISEDIEQYFIWASGLSMKHGSYSWKCKPPVFSCSVPDLAKKLHGLLQDAVYDTEATAFAKVLSNPITDFSSVTLLPCSAWTSCYC